MLAAISHASKKCEQSLVFHLSGNAISGITKIVTSDVRINDKTNLS